MDLFTELDLPVVIYCPHRSTGWCKTANATWADLEASLELQDRRAADLIEGLARFENTLDVLRPVMEPNPNMAVSEALAILGDLR